MPRTFAPEDEATVRDQYTQGSCEKLDRLVADGASAQDLRDAVLFLAGTVAGILQCNRYGMGRVNSLVAQFQEALDRHLLEHVPSHAGINRRPDLLN